MSAPLEQEKLKLCHGCRNDFYNGTGARQCWSLKDAVVVRRWRLGWWTQPTSRAAFEKVWTLDCHHATGKYAQFERLPQHLGGEQA